MLFVFFFAVLGAIAGSFAGAVSERLHTGHSWFSGRSSCDACGTILEVSDLVPVISWLRGLGTCRHCGTRFGIRHLLTESLLAFLFALSYGIVGLTAAVVPLLVALTVLTIIVLYDLRHTIIPHGLSVLLGLCALVYFVLTPFSFEERGFVLLSAGAYGAAFFALHVFSRGRAMGLADTPLVISLALLAGSRAFAGLLFSFWIGAVIGILILVQAPRGRKMGIEVPFAPFLAAGFLLATFTAWDPILYMVSVIERIIGI